MCVISFTHRARATSFDAIASARGAAFPSAGRQWLFVARMRRLSCVRARAHLFFFSQRSFERPPYAVRPTRGITHFARRKTEIRERETSRVNGLFLPPSICMTIAREERREEHSKTSLALLFFIPLSFFVRERFFLSLISLLFLLGYLYVYFTGTGFLRCERVDA